MRTGVTIKVDLMIGVGGRGRENGVVGDERILVVRVSHHTYNRIIEIAGGSAVATQPETQLKVGDCIVVGVKDWQDEVLVGVARGVIGIETDAVRAAVGIGAIAVDIRGTLIVGTGTVVVVVPARRKYVGHARGGSAASNAIEVLDDGQCSKRTLGMELIHKRPVAAVATAYATYIYIVHSAGVETCDVNRIGIDIADNCASAEGKSSRAVLHFVFSSDGGSPGDGGIGLGDAVGRNIEHTRAGGSILKHDIIEIGVPSR